MDELNTDPLLQLLVDDVKAVDREKLARFLKGRVFFNKDNGEMNFTESFSLLSNLDKLEIVFIADKARFLILPNAKEEGLSQKDILVLDIMPQGSVKSSLKSLSDSKRVIKNKKDKYYIPNYRLTEIFNKYER